MRGNKKKTLPKNFEALLERGDLDELKSVFASCDVNAKGGYAKQTALSFDNCPDDLAKWLVERGADINAVDYWGNTPLHSRARSRNSGIQILISLGADINYKNDSIGTPLHSAADSHNLKNVKLLIECGSKINELNREKLNPLEAALRSCNNIDIIDTLDISRVFLEAGVKKTAKMKNFVIEIGKNFEFHRQGFDSKIRNQFSNALDQLYELFEVTPVPSRNVQDLNSPIIVKSNTWRKQYEELWNLLVPSSGCAETIQGEIIRISGRISNEIEGNGGSNWDTNYSKMADAFLELIGTEETLS